MRNKKHGNDIIKKLFKNDLECPWNYSDKKKTSGVIFFQFWEKYALSSRVPKSTGVLLMPFLRRPHVRISDP